jgi:hypothetical protein
VKAVRRERQKSADSVCASVEGFSNPRLKTRLAQRERRDGARDAAADHESR